MAEKLKGHLANEQRSPSLLLKSEPPRHWFSNKGLMSSTSNFTQLKYLSTFRHRQLNFRFTVSSKQKLTVPLSLLAQLLAISPVSFLSHSSYDRKGLLQTDSQSSSALKLSERQSVMMAIQLNTL